jgi:hypothetical protein
MNRSALLAQARSFRHGTFRDFWALIRPTMSDDEAEHLCELLHAVFDAGWMAESTHSDPVLDEKVQRYGFLSGLHTRTDDEDVEVHALLQWLRDENCDPGWTPVPRQPSPGPRRPR